MDQQNNNTPKHIPTAAEIARLEAEAAAAIQRGEAIPRCEPAPEGDFEAPAQAAPPAQPDFVPYVDDVPEPVKPKPEPVSEAPVEDEDEDDDEYIPSEMEKRIDKLTQKQWKLWQIAGGAAVGAVCIGSLFILGEEMAAYSLILAAVLAILLPRYLERSWRRKLNTARYAMMVTMLIGLAIMFVVTGIRTGFRFTSPK